MDTKPKMYRELGIAIQSHKYATNTVKKFIEYTKETVESLYKKINEKIVKSKVYIKNKKLSPPSDVQRRGLFHIVMALK